MGGQSPNTTQTCGLGNTLIGGGPESPLLAHGLEEMQNPAHPGLLVLAVFFLKRLYSGNLLKMFSTSRTLGLL